MSVVCGIAVGATLGAVQYAVSSGGAKRFSVKGLLASTAFGGITGGAGAKLQALSAARKTGLPRGGVISEDAFAHLDPATGLDAHAASDWLHILKDGAGLGTADDVVVGRTGDVCDAVTGERLGSLTDPGLGGAKRRFCP